MRSKNYFKKNGKGLTILRMSSLLATASILTCDIVYGLNTNVLNSANDNTYTPNYNQYLNSTLNNNNNTSIQNQSQNYLNNIKTPASTAQQAGSNLYNSSIQGTLGSKGAIHQNISTPMNGGSPLHTFNNAQSNQGSSDIVLTRGTPYLNNMHHQGNVQMYCPSSATAFDISIFPSTGYYAVTVQQSTQLNGTYDNQFVFDVSGVCENGIIMCNPPNSWNSCSFYKWMSDSNGKVSLVPAILPSDVGTGNGSVNNDYCESTINSPSAVYQEGQCYQLQGCMCVNASCGITGTSPIPNIASIIAGGIEQAVAIHNQNLLLSKGTFDVNTLSLNIMGQSMSNCNFGNYQQYSNLPLNPNPDQATQLENQEASDTNSAYYTLTESYTMKWGGQEFNQPNIQPCSISNQIQVQTVGGQDYFQLAHNDNCPSNCYIKDETICDSSGNCVTTYQHGFSTGNKPNNPTCTTINSSLSQYNVCTDGNTITVTNPSGQVVATYSGKPNSMWFSVQREEECSNGTTKSMGLNLNTVETAEESASVNGNTMSYQYSGPNGITSNQSAQLPGVQDNNTCPAQMCIVEYQEAKATVLGDGTNRSQIPGYNQQVVTPNGGSLNSSGGGVGVQKTLVCQQENGNYVCPATGNETIIQGCQCENSVQNNTGFDEAITVMSVADKLAQQFYCQ